MSDISEDLLGDHDVDELGAPTRPAASAFDEVTRWIDHATNRSNSTQGIASALSVARTLDQARPHVETLAKDCRSSLCDEPGHNCEICAAIAALKLLGVCRDE